MEISEQGEVQSLPIQEKKYHKLNTKHFGIYMFILLLLGVGVLMFSYFYYNFAINRPAQNDREITFEIERGMGVDTISKRLYESELINSEFLFKLYLIANNLESSVQAGVYTIPAGTSIIELAEMFQFGTNDVSVTFLEGWRVEEFALEADSNLGKIDYEKFVTIAQGSEGYLFPDTYLLNAEINEKELFNTLRSNFDKKTQEILRPVTYKDLQLSEEDVVILASLVEREISNPDDRPVIAGILIKRLYEGEILGVDATVQYAVSTLDYTCSDSSLVCPSEAEAPSVEWWPDQITQADLDFDSPYNTRKNTGLPPMPIASPGISAIEAVINYEESPYNYYLTDKEGITRFATTLEEHNANVVRYLY